MQVPEIADEHEIDEYGIETAPEVRGVEYIPSSTCERFILATKHGPVDEMRVLILTGPRGEGKTTSGLYACVALAQRLVSEGRTDLLPLRVAVVRDTWINLERTTLVSFRENARRGLPLQFKDQGREAIVGEEGVPIVHFYFFGLDRPADSDKLQGFSCGVLWLEEVAPAAELATGIPKEALGIGGTSVRQEGVPPRILCTLNPPDADHWILSVESALQEAGLADVLVKRYEIPPGEKDQHFTELEAEAQTDDERERWGQAAVAFRAYRARNLALLRAIGRMDLVARLVEGKVGGVTVGEAIVPKFSHRLHVAPGPLSVLPGLVYRFWDAGNTPSCVWAQQTPQGDLNVLGSRTGVNTGMVQFVQAEVIPFQVRYGLIPRQQSASFGLGARGHTFRDIGDPACLKRSESNSEETVARVIREALGAAFEPGPVPWGPRREALLAGFDRAGHVPGRMLIQIDPSENDLLLKGLGGRAHYKTDPSGRVNYSVEVAKSVSGLYFQALDALGYGLAILYPAEESLRRAARPAPPVPGPKPKSWVGV